MIRKILSLVAGLILIYILSGCSAQEASAANPDDTPINKVEINPTNSGFGGAYTIDEVVSMRVLWTVSGYVIGKGATWGEADAKALLFKPLDINETAIIFDGQACTEINFQKSAVNAAEYFSNTWQATTQELNIENKDVQVFKTNCTLPGFQEYVRLSDGRLIVPINGVFFFFDPAVTR
jgi:hypothetical protein